MWAGSGTTVPLAYSAWFLVPLLPWLPWRVLRDEFRALVGLFVVGIGYLALTLGPSNLWLFRWPARLLEYVWLAIFLILAVLVSRGLRTSLWQARAGASVFLVLFGSWLALSAQFPRCGTCRCWPSTSCSSPRCWWSRSCASGAPSPRCWWRARRSSSCATPGSRPTTGTSPSGGSPADAASQPAYAERFYQARSPRWRHPT